MAETKDKLVDLEDLKVLSDDTTAKLGGKLAVPLNEGAQGQVLTAKGDGTSEWADVQGGGLPEGYLIAHKNASDESYQDNQVLSKMKDGQLVAQSSISIVDGGPDAKSNDDITLAASKAMTMIILKGGDFDDRNYANSIMAVSEKTSAYISVLYNDGSGAHTTSMRANNEKSYITADVAEVQSIGVRSIMGPVSVINDANPPSSDKSNVIGYLTAYKKTFDKPSLVKPDGATIDVPNNDGVLSVKDGGITMSHLAQDVKDAISAGGGGTTVDEATIRRIVNEQLAKMKFTINDQGHLIIETPEA